MKKILFFILVVFSSLNAQELDKKLEIVAGYKMGVPSGDLGFYIRQGHGVIFQAMFKPKNFPLWIGGNIDYIIYGSKKTPQEYVFPDNTVANVDVNVNSSIASYQLALKYQFPVKSMIEPYAMLRMGGASFNTNLYIEDPRYDDECVALEQEHLHSSRTFNITPALGTKIYFSNAKNFFVDFNAGYSIGGEISFMNPTLGEDMSNPTHSHNTKQGNSEVTPYYVDFINRRTQVVHKHHVGNIYQSTFQMLNLRLGLGINF